MWETQNHPIFNPLISRDKKKTLTAMLWWDITVNNEIRDMESLEIWEIRKLLVILADWEN